MRVLADKKNLKRIGIGIAIVVFLAYKIHPLLALMIGFFGSIIFALCYAVYKKDTKPVYIVSEKDTKGTKEFIFEIADTNINRRQERIRDYIRKKIKNREIPVIYKGLSSREEITEYFEQKELVPQKYRPVLQKIPQGCQFIEKVEFIAEPTEDDKNAMVISIKGVGMVGYVPKLVVSDLVKILNTKKIKNILVVASGGDYKKAGTLREFIGEYKLKISIRYYEK